MKNKTKASPERLPKPTFWPFFQALGLMLILWGLLSNIIVILIGLIIFSVSIGGWISDLYHELKSSEDE